MRYCVGMVVVVVLGFSSVVSAQEVAPESLFPDPGVGDTVAVQLKNGDVAKGVIVAETDKTIKVYEHTSAREVDKESIRTISVVSGGAPYAPMSNTSVAGGTIAALSLPAFLTTLFLYDFFESPLFEDGPRERSLFESPVGLGGTLISSGLLIGGLAMVASAEETEMERARDEWERRRGFGGEDDDDEDEMSWSGGVSPLPGGLMAGFGATW